jgi:hypothetical protein
MPISSLEDLVLQTEPRTPIGFKLIERLLGSDA